MLEHLKNRAVALFAANRLVTLVTCGPAGLRSGPAEWRTRGLCICLLLPQEGEDLLNIAHAPQVILSGPGWQLQGSASPLAEGELPFAIAAADLEWRRVVRVTPQHLDIHPPERPGESLTIDFDEET